MTNGISFYYHPDSLIREFSVNASNVKWDMLHTILHCMYLHTFFSDGESAEKKYWNLACDISVEIILAELTKNRDDRRRKLSYLNCIDYLKRHRRYTPAQILENDMLQNMPGFEEDVLFDDFHRDDHGLWNRHIKADKDILEFWKNSTDGLHGQLNGSTRRRGSSTSGDWEEMQRSGLGKYDYRRFLRRFMFTREEVQTDPDSFDYIYYTLGMERYGNIPLIEHLEYQEANRMEQMVIAIDTSGSCDKRTVQQFLEETYRILSSKENFFRKMLVYVIQCDCSVQNVAIIHSEEEWKACSDTIRIQGRGGTDFTPVFRYVEKLQTEKQLTDLKALVYFTDGDGVYPDHKTSYETAFALLKPNEHMKKIPSWASVLVVNEES
ncbi:MAG: VWA-like domain-containing protein [Eubacteriales bacterium]|nr:VWA-like domain-containing protein [Eubacteriales bacterium]